MKTMRVMRLKKPAPIEELPLEAIEMPVPEPGPGEVRLQVRACGLCHTDLHIVEGELELPRLPLVPGHQIVGIVEAAGPGTRTHREGDRVGTGWLGGTCGRCRYCLADRENLCDRAEFNGLHRDGGYAEFAVVREEYAYPLPGSFPDLPAAPLLCAGVIGYRAYRLSETRPGERLGLFGFGASAHIILQVARHQECEVFVFTRSENHRRVARRLGAAWVGGAGDDPPERLDRAVLFAPAGRLVLDALRNTRKGGTVAIAAIHLTPIPAIDYGRLLYGERTIRSVTASTRRDARELLELAAEIPIRVETESFPLSEANRALGMLKRSEIDASGVFLLS
jgi:propanol-preferring alcohol dehydrogenase